MIPLLFCGIFVVLFASDSSGSNDMCLHPRNWNQLSTNGGYRLAGKIHLQLNETSFLVCVRECMLRSRCRSVNWRPRSCDLNYKVATHPMNLTLSLSHVYTDSRVWPTRLAESCGNHTCDNRSVCIPQRNGYTCKVEGCFIPWGSADWDINTSSTFYPVGAEVNMSCPSGYHPDGPRTCLSSGVWSDMDCVQMHRSCSELVSCNPQYETGGDFWLYSTKARTTVRIRCVPTTGTGALRPYLVFPEPNVFKSTLDSSTEDCYIHEYFDKVQYNGVAIDISTLTVNASDSGMFDYSNYPVPYGSVYDCSDLDICHQSTSEVVLNTTGTGFIIDTNSSNWSEFRLVTSMSITSSDSGRVVRLLCSGRCGACLPTNFIIRLQVDNYYRPDEASAIVPQCVLNFSEQL